MGLHVKIICMCPSFLKQNGIQFKCILIVENRRQIIDKYMHILSPILKPK